MNFQRPLLARLALLAFPVVLMGAHSDCDEGPGQCLAMPVCDAGETEVDGPSDCLQDDAVCYENEVCGTTIWCTGPAEPETVSCWEDAECGDTERCDTENFCDAPPGSGNGDAEAPAVCYGRCVDLEDTCEAIPVCAEGETEVSGPSECLQDDAVCYENEMCGTTIWCTGPADAS